MPYFQQVIRVKLFNGKRDSEYIRRPVIERNIKLRSAPGNCVTGAPEHIHLLALYIGFKISDCFFAAKVINTYAFSCFTFWTYRRVSACRFAEQNFTGTAGNCFVNRRKVFKTITVFNQFLIVLFIRLNSNNSVVTAAGIFQELLNGITLICAKVKVWFFTAKVQEALKYFVFWCCNFKQVF